MDKCMMNYMRARDTVVGKGEGVDGRPGSNSG